MSSCLCTRRWSEDWSCLLFTFNNDGNNNSKGSQTLVPGFARWNYWFLLSVLAGPVPFPSLLPSILLSQFIRIFLSFSFNHPLFHKVLGSDGPECRTLSKLLASRSTNTGLTFCFCFLSLRTFFLNLCCFRCNRDKSDPKFAHVVGLARIVENKTFLIALTIMALGLHAEMWINAQIAEKCEV